jgi:hypothetical protein
VATKQQLADKQLEILHDHYKETFARVCEVEKRRDRRFLWTIGLFGLLILEVGYPAEFGGSLKSVTVVGGELDLSRLPLAALLSATWVMTLAVALRYCQDSIWVDRQYPYVHDLEAEISPQLGGGTLYRREGQVYLDKYPMLLNVAWIAYVVVFPLLALIASLGLIVVEWLRLPYPWYHRVFDSAIAFALVACFFLYRVQPYLANKWRKRRESKSPSAAPE